MRLLASLFFTTVVSGACAAPHPEAGDSHGGKCLTQPAVKEITDNYAQVIGNYTDSLADKFISDDFTDTSDSINVLAQQPLGSVTFPSKAAFKAGQSQLPKIPLVVKSVNAVTCDTIVLRWTQTFGNPAKPAQGISILVNAFDGKKGWQLKTLYTEFNSLTYFTNTGGSCTPPPRA
ncbi:hypothetical protein PG993_008457 [Apiospora rasikravindrae]|uniref:NTF2-like domain-containing protein n=1 Tax=Apiospora rasikravindrae TaxID=990691 RepID=A0ABR1T0D7_9PEZI